MVHFGPKPVPETALGDLYGLTDGRASVLFVLLAGVGVALLAGRSSGSQRQRLSGYPPDEREASGRTARARIQLVLRGSLLLPLGLWLQGLENVILVVILQYYAVYFLIAALVLRLSDRWLAALILAVLAGGPLVYLWGTAAFPDWYFAPPLNLESPPGKLAHDLLLSGFYPVVTWAGPLLVGLWIGGTDLRSPKVRSRLIYLGLAITLVAASFSTGEPVGPRPEFSDLRVGEPHSQMPLWMLGAIGSACAMLGGTLVLADRIPKAIWPLAATGQLALTVYVGHALLLNYVPDLLRWDSVLAAALSTGAFMVVVATLSMLWRLVFSHGPLEAALAAPWLLLIGTWRFLRLGRFFSRV